MSDLLKKVCRPCEGESDKFSEKQIQTLLGDVPKWERVGGELARTFNFKNYYETMAFVNAVAFIAHRENHHPDLEVGYNRCRVRFSTHSAGGLSENDFISAAKVSTLIRA